MRYSVHGHSKLAMTMMLAATTVCLLLTPSAFAGGQSFTTLTSGVTQELYGTGPAFFGGVAFASNGDPVVDECQFGGSQLYRFTASSTLSTVNGTSSLHGVAALPSAAGCGLTNHPDGNIYSNTGAGVVELSASTGALLAGPYGPTGNALGIAPSPLTQDLVYVGGDGTLFWVSPSLSSTGTFSTALAGDFVDGIFFDPTGHFLFAADRSSDAVAVLDSTGALIQEVPLGHEPDGIAFHTLGSSYVVTNNTDGTMSRIDFGGSYSQLAVVSGFASGGFRGDLGQVGPDGCLYVTQDGTRYDDGTVTGSNSLVRLCPGFAPPPGVTPPSTLLLTTSVQTRPIVPDPNTSAFVNLSITAKYSDLTPAANAAITVSNTNATFHTNAVGRLTLVEPVNAPGTSGSPVAVTIHATAANGATAARSQRLYEANEQARCSFKGRPGIDTGLLSNMLPDPLGTIHDLLQSLGAAASHIQTNAWGYKVDVPASNSFYAQRVLIMNGSRAEFDGTGYSARQILKPASGLFDALQSGCTSGPIA